MTIKKLSIALGASLLFAGTANAGTDEYLGEILIGGYNFCPRGSIPADGQLLPISSYTALFSLYGTTYGGDGRTSFGIPNLQSRVPIHTGTGPGLTPRALGSTGGSEINTMTIGEMPSHTHRTALQTKAGTTANTNSPRFKSIATADVNAYVDGAPSGKFMHNNTVLVENAGASQSQNNMQPFLTLNYCVVTAGVFPSRN